MTFMKGHVVSLETREKLSRSLQGHIPWNKGKRYKQTIPVSEERKQKIRQALLGKKLSEEHRRAISKSHMGQKAWNKGLKMTMEFRIKVSNGRKGQPAWNKGITGKASHSFGHGNYEKNAEKRKEYARLGSLALFNKKGPTSLELKIYNFLQEHSISFEKQKLINQRFLVDAFIPSRNLVIECDGMYWHNLEKVKRKDKAENGYLKKCGFNLLRLAESEILDNSYERKLLAWL